MIEYAPDVEPPICCGLPMSLVMRSPLIHYFECAVCVGTMRYMHDIGWLETPTAKEPTWEEYLQREMPPLPLGYVTNTGTLETPTWGIDDGDTNDHDAKRPSNSSFMSKEKP